MNKAFVANTYIRFTKLTWAAYAEASVSGDPLLPVHGWSVTAAEIILSVPSADRSDVKKLRRLAASEAEYGFPAPGLLGYS